jgi:hypothetical protein
MAGPHASPPVTFQSRPSSDPEAMPVSAQGSFLQKGTNPNSQSQPRSPTHSSTGAPALFPDDEQQHHRQQDLVQQHHPAQQHNRMINTSRTRRNGNGNGNINGNGNGRSRGTGGKRRRSPLRILTSILYHTSFSFFLLVLAVILVVSAFGLSDQALRGPASVGLGNQRFLNFVITMGSYVVLVSPACFLLMSAYVPCAVGCGVWESGIWGLVLACGRSCVWSWGPGGVMTAGLEGLGGLQGL